MGQLFVWSVLAVGDCYNQEGDDYYRVLACDYHHQAEVVLRLSAKKCTAANVRGLFTEYVGVPYKDLNAWLEKNELEAAKITTYDDQGPIECTYVLKSSRPRHQLTQSYRATE